MRFLFFLTFSAFIFTNEGELKGHEFWVDPTKFIVTENEVIKANIRVGTIMRGTPYGYFPRNFKRCEVFSQDGRINISGGLGDKPALAVSPQGNNLVTLIYESNENFVTYYQWQKFVEFLTEKNLHDIAKTHLSKKFITSGFRERYIRYAKSLIGSGNSKGEDTLHDLEIEFVAQLNPYTSNLEDGLPIKLYYKKKPLPKFQVEIFSKNQEGTISQKIMLTNNHGQIVLRTQPKSKYLLNAVKIREPTSEISQKIKNEKTMLLWESLWASLTFMTPH